MVGYVCPFCLSPTDGPYNPDEGCIRCDEFEDKAFEQATSQYWEEFFDTETTDMLDIEDLL
ncbi:hypothetical protein LCGC14_3013040 [marine sediment metagenome]|uniref:Uncharacterized protein n=1 Tax=marine sediment metagenome TaxID=412755 RepID=A0A0F8WXJ5_9ZZZZ|nr:hypothetical protein [bacterium]